MLKKSVIYLAILFLLCLLFSCPSHFDDLMLPATQEDDNNNGHGGGGSGGGSYMVDDSLEATVLTTADAINLTWNAVPDVTGYAVYRYLSKADTNPVKFTAVSNEYNDTSCTVGAPYFYKVACIMDAVEYAETDYFAFGICFSSVDFYEPDNNDVSNILSNATDVFDPGEPPVIYSAEDGIGNVIKDIDWYKYRGPRQTIFARITLPNDTPFNDGELTFRWYYNGSYSAEESIDTGFTNEFHFDDFDSGAGDVDLYCEIIINVPAGINKTGSYEMEISTSL